MILKKLSVMLTSFLLAFTVVVPTTVLAEKEKGKTILLASHNTEYIPVLSDDLCEMDGGVMRKRVTEHWKGL